MVRFGASPVVLTVFGQVIVALLLGGMLRANAYRGRYLAKIYAGDAGPVIEKRNMRSAVLIGLGAFNSLKGIITITVHERGVSFRVMPLFALFHHPFVVPYSDIRGWKTTWYLDARSSELEFRCAPDVKLVLPAEDAEWIRSHADHEMTLSDLRPPQGNVGQGWHAVLVVQAFASLTVIGWLLAYFFLQ